MGCTDIGIRKSEFVARLKSFVLLKRIIKYQLNKHLEFQLFISNLTEFSNDMIVLTDSYFWRNSSYPPFHYSRTLS